jgi:predicted metal-dependent hydrolase
MRVTCTEAQLNLILKEAISNIRKLGLKSKYRVKRKLLVSSRYRTAWAKCCYDTKTGFEICISDKMFTANLEAARTIIYHEVIHTLPGCFNHGPNFKNAAALINKRFTVKVSRFMTEENFYNGF